jgi:hypothetical protein
MRRCSIALMGVLVVTWFVPAPPVWADTLVEANVETRVSVTLRVPEATLQAMLPSMWQSVPVPAGPFKGANLVLVFIDYLVAQDAGGKPAGTGTDRVLVLSLPAKQ